MSLPPADEPATSPPSEPSIATVIDARRRDLGGFEVRRLLPSRARRLVGPVVFFDHMGPSHFAPGAGLDVRPHPHIGLATVTYLFEGVILHRDSLGSSQPIEPGEVNWMTAGRGIVHSERTPPALRAEGSRLHGLQLWVALPRAQEEDEPSFRHHDRASIPGVQRGEATLRVIAGSAYGLTSPVQTRSPLCFVDVRLPQGAALALPREQRELAAYVVEGAIRCAAQHAAAGRMLVFATGVDATLTAVTDSHVVLIGGAALDGERHIDWNFVSSSVDRLAQARDDWRAGRFPPVPGDDGEPIPYPGRRS